MYHFLATYFAHYVKVEFAPFHQELCDLLQAAGTPDDLTNIIIGFRGSAKSTIVNVAFPIWRVVTERSHFALMLADTLPQAKMHISNLRDELETNTLLKNDWGPFEPDVQTYADEDAGDSTWTKTDMVLRKYKAKIIARSMGQKVRGSLFKQWRPDTIIGDDLEDLKSVRTKEERDKRYKWVVGEAFASGEEGTTKRVVVGNLLHTDSLVCRLRSEIDKGTRSGKSLSVPLIRDNGFCTWTGRYPDWESIERKKKDVGDLSTWMREFLLKIVPDTGQPVLDDWIRYYDELPREIVAKGIGNDLAISKKDTADYTTFVPAYMGYVREKPEEPFIFIRPTFAGHLTFRETITQARTLINVHGNDTMLFVENVAYQAAAIEEMRDREFLPVTEVVPGSDKLARLRAVATHIQSGKILFPRSGCEDLIIQLVHFGVEAHDDLVDAFVYVVLGLLKGYANRPTIFHA